jgi:hypothetical protein
LDHLQNRHFPGPNYCRQWEFSLAFAEAEEHSPLGYSYHKSLAVGEEGKANNMSG